MHLTAKIQQSYISLSSVNCDASLRTVNLKNRENACLLWRSKSLDADLSKFAIWLKETSFRFVQKEKIREIIANQSLAALTGSAFSRSLNRFIGKQKYATNGR